MRTTFKTFIAIAAFVLLSSGTSAQLQNATAIRDSIYTIMLSFPYQFYSLRGGPSYDSKYQSTLFIPDTHLCVIGQNEKNGSWEWECTVTTIEDEDSEDDVEKKYNQWRKMLDNLELGGVRLVPYKGGKYSLVDPKAKFEEVHAWRLDNSRNNIDPRFQKFTIRLEAIDYDGEYLEVKLVISDY